MWSARCSVSIIKASYSSSNLEDRELYLVARWVKLRRLGTRLLEGVAGADLEDVRVPGDIREGLTEVVDSGMYKLDFLIFLFMLSTRRCRRSSVGFRASSGLVGCGGESKGSFGGGWMTRRTS